MNNHKKILLRISGQLPIYFITAAVVIGLFDFQYIPGMILVLSTARFLLYLTRGPKPFFENYLIRKKLKRLVEDELRMSVIFLATLFLLSWPVSINYALGFILINYIGQMTGLYLSDQIYKTVKRYSNNNAPVQKIVIIGSGLKAKEMADLLLETVEAELELIGFLDFKRQGFWSYRDIPLIGHPSEIEQISIDNQLGAVVLAVENDEWIFAEKLFEVAETIGLKVCVSQEMFTPKYLTPQPSFINGRAVMTYRATPASQLPLFIKDAFDKAASLVTLIISSPLLLIISLMVKLDSRGPILYKQKRCGQNGQPFTIYKFRTMIKNAEQQRQTLEAKNEMSPPVFKIKDDPRITRVGRFLRKSSLDELPQLYNILKGQMSLVGPRPQLPDEIAQYKPWQRRRLSFKPGLTGLWQSGGRNNLDFDQWVKLDLDYIDNWSLLGDAKIIARTIPTVLKGEGAS